MNIPQTANIFNHLHQNYGNAFLKNGIQAKFKIGKSDDFYEQEADRVADAVIRMPDPYRQKQTEDKNGLIKQETASSHITPIIQNNQSVDQFLLSKNCLESRIHNLKKGGKPLSKTVRTFFESRFNNDFSKVRIHKGFQAAEIAHGLNSQAFTLGNNIVFGAGLFAPETVIGKKLLAHELTHVMQQRGNDLCTIRRNGEMPSTGPGPELPEELPVPTERIYIIWPEDLPEISELKKAMNYFKNLLNREVHVVPSIVEIFDDLYDVGFLKNIQVNRLIIVGHGSISIGPPPEEIAGSINMLPPEESEEWPARNVGAEEVKQFVLSNKRAEAVREYVMAKGAVVEYWGCLIGQSRTFMEAMSETFKTEFRAPTGFFKIENFYFFRTLAPFEKVPREKEVTFPGESNKFIQVTNTKELEEIPEEIKKDFKLNFKLFMLNLYIHFISTGEISETMPPRNEEQRFSYMKDLFNRCGGEIPHLTIITRKKEIIYPFAEKIQEWHKMWEVSFPPRKKM